jgi:hypothetical protein
LTNSVIDKGTVLRYTKGKERPTGGMVYGRKEIQSYIQARENREVNVLMSAVDAKAHA